MTSKTISITEEVYNELKKLKRDNESFSQLFLRILSLHKQQIDQFFGSWDLSNDEKLKIWNDLSTRPSRRWSRRRNSELR
ncbi:MAG: antitoxin VapB family protein [Candidatus Helarchaeota archaeon]